MPTQKADSSPASPPPAITIRSSGISLTPDLLDEVHRAAVAQAAEELLGDEKMLQSVWPGAYDARVRKGIPLDLGEVELVVLHLDRIGARAGASGAQVFAAYFVHRPPSPAECEFLSSPPLIMKLGDYNKLEDEHGFIEKWPTLTDDVSARLALPIALSGPPENGVLWSPFRSEYRPGASGRDQRVGLSDLWAPLNSPDEMAIAGSFDERRIGALVGNALDIMSRVHRANRPRHARETGTYADLYDWYLRNTTTRGHPREKLMTSLFGDGDTTRRFGQEWPNPRKLIAELVDKKVAFKGVFGPVHGDLHPKNIVLGHDAVCIIDFGWAHERHHVVVDYLLLDHNLRAVTLPPHIPEDDVLSLARYLKFDDDVTTLPPSVAARARVIRDAIWTPALNGEKIVEDWRTEYLIPYFLVAYGLLVYLAAARNQDALIAAVLAAAKEIDAGRNDA